MYVCVYVCMCVCMYACNTYTCVACNACMCLCLCVCVRALHLEVGDGGAEVGAPVDHVLPPVHEAPLVEADEGLTRTEAASRWFAR
jgi:hypothetical protein